MPHINSLLYVQSVYKRTVGEWTMNLTTFLETAVYYFALARACKLHCTYVHTGKC